MDRDAEGFLIVPGTPRLRSGQALWPGARGRAAMPFRQGLAACDFVACWGAVAVDSGLAQFKTGTQAEACATKSADHAAPLFFRRGRNLSDKVGTRKNRSSRWSRDSRRTFVATRSLHEDVQCKRDDRKHFTGGRRDRRDEWGRVAGRSNRARRCRRIGRRCASECRCLALACRDRRWSSRSVRATGRLR